MATTKDYTEINLPPGFGGLEEQSEADAIAEMSPDEYRELVPLQERIAVARESVMEQRWAEADAKETLELTRYQYRQALIEKASGDLKSFGPNAEAQTAAIAALLAADPVIDDLADRLRIATRDRERAELTLTVLLDARTDEHWGVRREAVARGVSLGDGAS